MTAIGRWRQLSGAEQVLTAAAVVALLLAPLAVHLRPIPDLVPVRLRRRRLASMTPARVLAIVGGVAARLPWHSPCLVRSVAAAWLLAWTGRPVALVLAVRRAPGGIESHAWVRADDAALGRPAGDAGWHVVTEWPVPRAVER